MALVSRRPSRRVGVLLLVGVALLLVISACTAPAPAPAAEPQAAADTPAPVVEPTEAPEAEPTAAPEPEPTAVPESEPTAVPEPETSAGDPVAGEYILSAAIGCGCHFNRDAGGLAGGNKFEGGFGLVYSRNLTQDVTGIAGLSDQEVIDAFRLGKRPGGGNLAPVMPRFASMSDEDALNLVAFLRSRPALANEVADPQLTSEPADFTPNQPPPAVAPTEGAARGGYLASLARCGNCHTPRTETGGFNNELFLAGAPYQDTVAPNLTPDEATGLTWTEQEIADFLGTGIYSDGLEAHAGMKGTVDRGLGKLTEADRLAIAAFLKTLSPIQNAPAAQ